MPYAVVEWLIERVLTPNEFRVWLEEMMRTDVNFQKENWELFFEFKISASQMNPNGKKSSVLLMEVELVTAKDPKFLKWAY